LYDKGKILYGLDKAKVEIRKKDFCILVEGYTDVILAHQSGFENTISTSGTALTPYQLEILKRYSENLYLAFDMDIAGDFATKRGIDLAQLKGFNIKVVKLPEGKDPADVISEDPKVFENAILNSLSILDFYFESAFSKFDKTKAEGKKEISKILLPVIKRIPNQIERAHWISRLAKMLEVREEDVEKELEKLKLEEESFGLEIEEIVNLPQKSREELLEERFLVLLLKSPENINLVDEEKISFFSEKSKEILLRMKENPKFKTDELSKETQEYFNIIALRSEVEEVEKEDILPEMKFCLKEIQSLKIKEKLKEISEKIKKAEEEKKTNELEKLTQEFDLLSKKLTQI
jgi:DNA primase